MSESARSAVPEQQQDLAVVRGEANARLFLLSLATVVPISVVLMGFNDLSHGYSLLLPPLVGLVVPLILSRRAEPRPTQVGLITAAVVVISIATEWATIAIALLLGGV
jgi:hypothetical protein